MQIYYLIFGQKGVNDTKASFYGYLDTKEFEIFDESCFVSLQRLYQNMKMEKNRCS
jgi:hypothetical protein